MNKKNILLLVAIFTMFSCAKYDDDDLLVLEEMVAVTQQLADGVLTKEEVRSKFKKEGYVCYVNRKFDSFYVDSLMTTQTLIYQKSTLINGGKVLKTNISVSPKFKKYLVSTSYNKVVSEPNVIQGNIISELTIYKMGEYNMKFYNRPSW